MRPRVQGMVYLNPDGGVIVDRGVFSTSKGGGWVRTITVKGTSIIIKTLIIIAIYRKLGEPRPRGKRKTLPKRHGEYHFVSNRIITLRRFLT